MFEVNKNDNVNGSNAIRKQTAKKHKLSLSTPILDEIKEKEDLNESMIQEVYVKDLIKKEKD